MTDSELEAEGVMTQTFCLAFRTFKKPTAEQLDRALVSELRETRPVGKLTLKAECETAPAQVRHTTKRADFERAVVGLPSTERIIFLMHDVESYDHSRIARTLGITEEESVAGLFQARLKIRQLLFLSMQLAPLLRNRGFNNQCRTPTSVAYEPEKLNKTVRISAVPISIPCRRLGGGHDRVDFENFRRDD